MGFAFQTQQESFTNFPLIPELFHFRNCFSAKLSFIMLVSTHRNKCNYHTRTFQHTSFLQLWINGKFQLLLPLSTVHGKFTDIHETFRERKWALPAKAANVNPSDELLPEFLFILGKKKVEF
jgi:hypothetical protein